jgi:hypothetical protein
MNDNSDKFKFTYDGITYTVSFLNLDSITNKLETDFLEQALEYSNMAEAKSVINKIKNLK